MSLANILSTDHTASTKQLPSFQPGTRKKLEHFSYALTDIIGKGYSSQVFRGKNDLTNEPVAIKVIDMKMLKCQVNRTLLTNEIENLKMLSYTPCILQLYEVYNTKNNTYIITELCDSDLSKKIKKKCTEQEAYGYITQLLEGYQHLHKKEIIHRDLKPANVLMKDGTLKIADFGFSISAKEALKPSKYNVGSPLYMAPESLRRNEYSYKSDIWALGVIYYEMLFSQPPWRAKNEKQLLKKIETESIQTLLGSNPSISPQSKEFIIRCLTFDRNDRMGPEDLEKYNFKGNSSVVMVSQLYPKPFREKVLNERVNQTSYVPPTLNQYIVDEPKRNQENQNFTKSVEKRDKSNLENKKKASSEEEIPREDRKEISRMLISQVHFCRFLFKLSQRIRAESGLVDTEQLLRQYAGVIMHKIINVKDFENFNFLGTSLYEAYKQCNDFTKIKKIGKQYYIRYSEELPQTLTGYKFDVPRTIQATASYISQLAKKLTEKVTADNIGTHTGEIIVLDYLVTTYQLLGLIKDKEDYARFARKSKIEEIVEGSPTNITANHFQKILEKIADLGL